MRLPPYSAYKSSGVEWLGEVPAHWEVLKLKHWLTVNQQTLSESTDPDFTFDYVDIGSVGTGQLVSNPERLQFRDCPSRARRVVRAGDTILSMVRTYLKAVWHANKVKSDLVASTGFAVLTPKPSTCAKFVSYLCQSEHFTNRVTANSVGIAYPAIAETKLETFEVGVPPLYEQNGITRFLDHASDQIERYIRAKEKLIALLEEQKQVMIHDAVTGRIDVRTGKPYPAYRPSDVEWLGTIPATWKTIRTKYLLKEVDLRSVTGEETPLSMSQVLGLVPSSRVERSLATASYVGGKLCDEGDLVLNRLKAHLGVFALAQQSGIVSPDYSVFRKRSTANMNFLEQVFRLPALRTELRTRSKGIVEGFWRLYTDDFFDIFIPVPTEHEQRRIVDYISQVSKKLKRLIDRSKREANLVREYRTRLIADVVTGKLDVREAAANLPELEVIANGGDKTIPAEPDSQQSNTTLHPPTTPGVGS